jgi:anti-sigma28 factor (negative regulator of flagellin synthesis)
MRRIRVLTPSPDGRVATIYVRMTRERDPGRRRHIEQLRERIETGSYEVDPHAVAEAILRRLRRP